MTITEILNLIHDERVELEIYEKLHKWILGDRADWIARAMDYEMEIEDVRDMVMANKSAEEIIEECNSHLEYWNE